MTDYIRRNSRPAFRWAFAIGVLAGAILAIGLPVFADVISGTEVDGSGTPKIYATRHALHVRWCQTTDGGCPASPVVLAIPTAQDGGLPYLYIIGVDGGPVPTLPVGNDGGNQYSYPRAPDGGDPYHYNHTLTMSSLGTVACNPTLTTISATPGQQAVAIRNNCGSTACYCCGCDGGTADAQAMTCNTQAVTDMPGVGVGERVWEPTGQTCLVLCGSDAGVCVGYRQYLP